MKFLIFILLFKYSYSYSGVFWHICDIHLNITYNTSHKIIGRFGSYASDSPLTLVKSAINAMHRIEQNPDFIIWNGDNAAHMRLKSDAFLETVSIVSATLFERFPTTVILPSLGNHDLNPSNNIGKNSKWCEDLFEVWKIFFKDFAKDIGSFKIGCYYSRIVNLHNETIKVIILNTILWFSENKEVHNLDDPLNQFQWLKSEFQDARNNSLKVLLVGHVPPGASEYTPQVFRHLYPKFNIRLLEILQLNSDIIEAGFFSHEHTDSFKVVYNSKGVPVVPLFLSPSVTPFYLRGMGSVNPSIRLYSWPKASSQRLYSQYHTELNGTASDADLNWSLEYNSTDMLPGLSAPNLDSLITNFTSKNPLYFQRFFKRHLSGRPHDHNETCALNSVCRCNIICGMRCIDYVALELCLRNCKPPGDMNQRAKINKVPLIVGVILVFVLILIATVIGVNKVYCHRRNKGSLTRDIFMAKPNGNEREQIIANHIDDLAEITFGDVPEYKGHFRNNSRTILTLNDGNETVEKPEPPAGKFAISSRTKKSREKYEYSRI